MHDVARRARVSQKTVSRVINGEATVSEDTAGRVLKAADELGYRRNDGARLLRQGAATSSIGIVTEDLAGPFYSEILSSVQRTVQLHDHLLLTGSGAGESQRFYSLIRAFVHRRVDGLLIAPTAADDDAIAHELVSGLPCVFVDRPPSDDSIDSVVSDNIGGTAAAVRHLIAHGHRRIGFIGDDPSFWTARQRLDGFRGELAANGLTTEYVWMAPSDSAAPPPWDSGADGPTAVITGNGPITLRQLLRRKDRPDDRGALIGFDDVEYAELPDPALTVIAQQAGTIAETAARLLFERIAEMSGTAVVAAGAASAGAASAGAASAGAASAGPPQALTVPTMLIERGSGEVPPRSA